MMIIKTDSIEFWIVAILNLIMLIVFLRMAWNVAQLRKGLVRTTPSSIYSEIEKLKFMGKTDQILELYYNLLWEKHKQKSDFPEDKAKELHKIALEIKELGGKTPREIWDFINKYPGKIRT